LLPEPQNRTALLLLAVELLRSVGGAREDLAPVSRSIGLERARKRPGRSRTVLKVIDLASLCSTRFLRHCTVLVEQKLGHLGRIRIEKKLERPEKKIGTYLIETKMLMKRR